MMLKHPHTHIRALSENLKEAKRGRWKRTGHGETRIKEKNGSQSQIHFVRCLFATGWRYEASVFFSITFRLSSSFRLLHFAHPTDSALWLSSFSPFITSLTHSLSLVQFFVAVTAEKRNFRIFSFSKEGPQLVVATSTFGFHDDVGHARL